jgi:hypothetical protein
MAKEKKHVGATLKTILDNPVMKTILDRSQHLDEVIETVKGYWGYDMYTRKPGPALVDGVFEGTDLDLACFLTALADRGAVINIPKYKSMRPSTIVEGQRISSKDNRHGKILKLVSNKDVFSFGINIMDMNVMTTDSVGDFRTFSLTTPDGNWYDGWERIEFDPSAKENQFLTENKIWTENKVIFKYFVHPNRWISFYGQYYFITKALIARLTEQAADNYKQIKEMLAAGINYPESGVEAKKEWPSSKKEEGKSVKFESMEVEIDTPDAINEYLQYDHDQKALILLTNQRRLWNNTIIPMLNFSARITEYAFYKHGRKADGNEKMPAWLSGGTVWERNFKFPRKRVEWDRLKLVQPGVGAYSVAIRKRLKTKSEIMNKSFQGGL